MNDNKDHFEILRTIQKKPQSSQRALASELDISLGKLNYCLKALQNKGFVKLQNFQKQSNKIHYLRYVITYNLSLLINSSERIRLTYGIT